MDVTAYNHYPDIELSPPIYFCNHSTYYEYPIERMDDDAMINIGFRFDLDQDEPGGILMYKVQRKRNTESDHQSSTDITSSEAVEDTSKTMLLLVAWKIEHSEGLGVRILLVEHDNRLVLNEDKLAQLYNKVNDIPSGLHGWAHKYDGILKSTWLMCNNIVLRATYEIIFEKSLGLKIAISKGVKDEDTELALWIDSERQVSSLIVLRPMLIYVVSLTLQSIVNMTIDNQCSDIELASPVHFIKDAMCHIHFPQQVNSKSKMKVTFKTRMNQYTFSGALLYHLQEKEDTHISTQLLMIWGRKSDKFYSHTLIIEHESTLIWKEDKLEKLYHVYDSQDSAYSNTGIWLLNDDKKLQAKCETSRGGFEMNIIISEKEYLSLLRKPLWVNSNR
jgi:hypothetical protein